MKVIKVIRYRCDFCKHSSYSKKRILGHEKVCFHNPDRVCKCGKTVNDYDLGGTDGCAACDCYLNYLNREEYEQWYPPTY